MRGVAAILVLTRHVPDKTIDNLLPGSYLAVDLFFVLSGFVLAHSYLHKLRNAMTTLTFVRLRLIRLYPLYILGTVLNLPNFFYLPAIHVFSHARYGILEWAQVFGSAVFALFFLPTPPGVSPDTHIYPLNYPAWSLFFELFINLVFAFVAARLSPRVLILVLAFGSVLLAITSVHYGDLNVGWEFSNFWGGGSRVIYSFFAGIAVYRIWAGGFIQWFRLPIPVATLLILMIFALDPMSSRFIYDLGVTILVFPLLVLGAAATEPRAMLLSVCNALGRASYAIYVLQIALIFWITHVVMKITHRDFKTFGLAGTVVIVAFVILSSLLFDRYYDLAARSAMSRLLRSRPVGGSARTIGNG